MPSGSSISPIKYETGRPVDRKEGRHNSGRPLQRQLRNESPEMFQERTPGCPTDIVQQLWISQLAEGKEIKTLFLLISISRRQLQCKPWRTWKFKSDIRSLSRRKVHRSFTLPGFPLCPCTTPTKWKRLMRNFKPVFVQLNEAHTQIIRGQWDC